MKIIRIKKKCFLIFNEVVFKMYGILYYTGLIFVMFVIILKGSYILFFFAAKKIQKNLRCFNL